MMIMHWQILNCSPNRRKRSRCQEAWEILHVTSSASKAGKVKFEYSSFPLFYPRGWAAPLRGITPIALLERFVVYCSSELIISGRTSGRGPDGTGNCSGCYATWKKGLGRFNCPDAFNSLSSTWVVETVRHGSMSWWQAWVLLPMQFKTHFAVGRC